MQGDNSPFLNRKDRRRFAKNCLENKLQSAYKYIRELEARCVHVQHVHIDPVLAEVEGRLGLIRPLLRTLVTAGQTKTSTTICGSAKAFRNFGAHADMGCGVAFLPKDSREAKRRNRGQGRTPTAAKRSIDDGADHGDLDVPNEGDRPSMRFKEVLCVANGCSSDGQAACRDNIPLDFATDADQTEFSANSRRTDMAARTAFYDSLEIISRLDTLGSMIASLQLGHRPSESVIHLKSNLDPNAVPFFPSAYQCADGPTDSHNDHVAAAEVDDDGDDDGAGNDSCDLGQANLPGQAPTASNAANTADAGGNDAHADDEVVDVAGVVSCDQDEAGFGHP